MTEMIGPFNAFFFHPDERREKRKESWQTLISSFIFKKTLTVSFKAILIVHFANLVSKETLLKFLAVSELFKITY